MARTGTQSKLYDTLPLGSEPRAALKATLEPRASHGGLPSLHKRKTARPFAPKAPIHLVLKSARAKGNWSLLHRKHQSKITSMIYVYAKRFKVHVYRSSNAGNHLHLLVKAEEKKHLADFLRVLAGRIAVTVTGAQKGVKRIGKFWEYLTWSRLVNWGKDFFQVRAYVENNGSFPYLAKDRPLKRKPAVKDDGPSMTESSPQAPPETPWLGEILILE